MSFSQLSNGLADAVASVAPSLYGLIGRRRSGTAVSVGENRAITAAHLLGKATGTLALPDGGTTEARVVGVSPALDLALLEVDTALPALSWSDTLRVGQLVVPVGFGPRASLGLVARLGGPWRTPPGAEVDRWIEVDGTLPAGFSGGPLVGPDGVVGVNTHRLVRGGTTLSAATVQATIARLEAHGTVEPGFLGIGAATATLTKGQAAAASQDEALLVVAVEPGSPAEGALTVGDIVLRVDGTEVRGVRTLRGALTGLGAGHTATLDVLVGDTVESRSVTLGARPGHVD